jgi:ribokinase
VVLGDVMLDVIVRARSTLAPASDTPANIRVMRGGSGASLAIALRACGPEVVFVGASGNDVAHDVFVTALLEADITPQLEIVDARTGTVVSIVAGDGQRSMLTDRGANSLLSESFVSDQLNEPFDHLHVSGYLLLDPARKRAGSSALERARELGRTASVDVCSVEPLRQLTPSVFLEAAKAATLLFANEAEALVLTSTSDLDAALEVLAASFDEVVITAGGRGAVSSRGAERYRALARDVMVLDTTGAGDAATGAYLGARLSNVEPAMALDRAMEAGSRVVGGLGAHG